MFQPFLSKLGQGLHSPQTQGDAARREARNAAERRGAIFLYGTSIASPASSTVQLAASALATEPTFRPSHPPSSRRKHARPLVLAVLPSFSGVYSIARPTHVGENTKPHSSSNHRVGIGSNWSSSVLPLPGIGVSTGIRSPGLRCMTPLLQQILTTSRSQHT